MIKIVNRWIGKSRSGSIRIPYKNMVLPGGTLTFGLGLFLVALTMFFVAGIVSFVIIRVSGPNSPPMGDLKMPVGLWVSTGLLLASGFTFHRAVQKVRYEKQAEFRRDIMLTGLLTIAFLIVQAFSLAELLAAHEVNRVRGFALYSLVMSLVIIHAVHVIGGLVPLGVVTKKSFEGRYDHEAYEGVRHCAMYWHFLEAVWLVMVFTFMIAS